MKAGRRIVTKMKVGLWTIAFNCLYFLACVILIYEFTVKPEIHNFIYWCQRDQRRLMWQRHSYVHMEKTYYYGGSALMRISMA